MKVGTFFSCQVVFLIQWMIPQGTGLSIARFLLAVRIQLPTTVAAIMDSPTGCDAGLYANLARMRAKWKRPGRQEMGTHNRQRASVRALPGILYVAQLPALTSWPDERHAQRERGSETRVRHHLQRSLWLLSLIVGQRANNRVATVITGQLPSVQVGRRSVR